MIMIGKSYVDKNLSNIGTSRYNCVVFDVDGTLIDTEKAVFLSYQKVFFEEFGKCFKPEDMRTAYGVPTEEALRRLSFTNVKEAGKRYNEILMENFREVRPFEGIIEILDFLKTKDILTGIVTSRNKDEVCKDICLQGLMGYFKFAICADDTEKHKPNPDPLLKLIEKAGIDKANTVYIGDTLYDYMCARDAGVDFALALWGAKDPKEIEAKYNLKKPEDVLSFISV